MDPLSVIASIIAILQLSNKVMGYLNDVKDAPKERRRCAIEITNLHSLLTNLRFRVEDGDPSTPWFDRIRELAKKGEALDQFNDILKLLADEMTDSKGRLGQLTEALVWKFKKDEMDRIMKSIERLKLLVLAAMEMDHFKLSSAIKADTDNIRNQLPLVQNGIENLRHEGALAQLNALKAWISRTDPVAQQSDISRRRCEGTGQWFLDTPEFVEWLGKSSIGRTLLCTGMPGAGKTILAAVAIDHLSRKRRCSTVGVAWLFLNYKSQREQTIEFILATILRQLVQLETPGTVEHARVLKQEHDKSITTPNETEYYKTLQAVLAEFDTVYIVVDALDESQEGTRRKLLDHTKALQKAADVCLLFTSRGIPDIANAFETASKLEIRAIDEDVKLFVADQMEALPNCVRKNDALRQLVQDSIARAIDGMFLLARLHVDSLQDKRTKSDVWSALDTLSNPSQTLEKTYEDATKRLRSQLPGDVALATKVITWIVYAQRQLTTTELGHALAVKPLETSLDDDGLYDIEEVVSLCAGLVVIDEGTNVIRLVHYTTQQYFEEIRESWNPQGQLELARTCLTYLSYAEFRQDRTPSNELIDTRLKAYPFLKYAAFYWSDHAMTVQPQVFDLAYSLLLDNALITNFARVVRDWQFFGLEDGQSYYTGTALHVLASLGLLYMAKEVHARFRSDFDAWVNKENDLGYTCLFCAVYREDEPMVRLLLDKGADVNVLYGPMGGRSPLLWLAIAMKNLEIVQLMIDRGADLHLVNHDEEIDDEISAILVAASVGHIGIIQLLFDNGADLSIVSSRKRYTAIYLAASRGYLDVVRFLLDKGVDADSPDNEGCTAMHIAAMYGNASIVGILLDRGATASLLDDEGRAAIHVAVENGQSNIVQLLWARGADPDLPTGDGKNAVSLAAQSGQYKLVELLLEKNADPNMILSDGWTAIHVAAQLGHSKTVQLLLNKGVDPNVASQGTTAITLGSSRGHIEVVQLLLKGGADPNMTNDETAIFKATESGHLEVVQLLLEGGADPNLPTVDGRLPIHAAADGGYLKIVQILLDKGVDFDAVDKECGRTAVYAAARHGHVEIVRLLLEKGANLNLPTSNGWTPLHRAAGCGHLSIVELLMHRGADVLATTHSRATPLTEAAWNGHAEVVDVLIRSCPDWRDIITPDGSVPAIVAKRGHVTILKHLHEKYVLDLQAPDNQSRHLVHIAARYGQSAIISFLVDEGISALTEDAKGDNILCYAASSGSLETVNRALELMPEPWTTDEGFWSPLHWACKAGNKEVVERLIEAGLQSTKVTLAQPEGEWSPIDVAMLHGHVDLLQGITDTFRSALGPPTTVKPQLVQNIRGQGGLICDGCEFHIFGVRFKCLICVDFDYCFMCKPFLDHLHDGHEWECTESWNNE